MTFKRLKTGQFAMNALITSSLLICKVFAIDIRK